MRNIILIIITLINLFACKSYKSTKDNNDIDLKKIKKNDTTIDKKINEIGKPFCNSNECDSVFICYKNIYYIYLNDDNILPYNKIADCFFNQLHTNKESHKCLVELYQSALIKQRRIADIDLIKLGILRGEEAFKTSLGWYKIQSTDPGYVAIDPAESFRRQVIIPMVKKINGKLAEDYEVEFQFVTREKKWDNFSPEEYCVEARKWWLNLYEKALAENTIVFREYGDVD